LPLSEQQLLLSMSDNLAMQMDEPHRIRQDKSTMSRASTRIEITEEKCEKICFVFFV
jgi:hypothetical protein